MFLHFYRSWADGYLFAEMRFVIPNVTILCYVLCSNDVIVNIVLRELSNKLIEYFLLELLFGSGGTYLMFKVLLMIWLA